MLTRTCIATRVKAPKKTLLRIVRTIANTVVIDYNYDTLGRGTYVQKDPQVIAVAIKKKLIERHLKMPLPEDVVNELLSLNW